MAKAAAHNPNANDEVPKTRFQAIFWTKRQTFIFLFYVFFFAVNTTLLGLVAYQIHKYGNEWTAYPDGRYYHALALGLFIGIFYTLVCFGHPWLNHQVLMFVHFAGGVFSGVMAGLLTMTPFGHGLQCGKPVDSFDPKFRPFVTECARMTATTGVAWAEFGINVLMLFWLAQDAYSLVTNHAHLYAPWEKPAKGKDIESDAHSHHSYRF